jgi:aconitate hydratase
MRLGNGEIFVCPAAYLTLSPICLLVCPTPVIKEETTRAWRELEAPTTTLFPWDETSTYIRRPPFAGFGKGSLLGTYDAHPLIVVGDDITTDHISPAGAIRAQSETGRYLTERGEVPTDLNVHASRRGNWEAMVRGLYTNRTVQNLLGSEIPPGSTIHAPSGEVLPLWSAANRYAESRQSVVIVAGERYGMGSSRDWAAKGASLLRARAVLAVSYERIHRSNLIGMGILPMRLPEGLGPDELALKSGDLIEIRADASLIAPRCFVDVVIHRRKGEPIIFSAVAAIETAAEVEMLKAGGILPLMLRNLVESQQ